MLRRVEQGGLKLDMMGPMSRAVRHLLACLLLVLLPFQALAASFAVADAPIVTCAEMMMDGMDCCDEDSNTCPDASNCAVSVCWSMGVMD